MKPLTLAIVVLAQRRRALPVTLHTIEWSKLSKAPPPVEAPLEAPAAKLAATLPDFQLADRAGEMRSLAHWSGKSLIVNFWATWCAPCRREIPLLEKLQARYGPEGFQVIGIAADYRDKVIAYADEIKIDLPAADRGAGGTRCRDGIRSGGRRVPVHDFLGPPGTHRRGARRGAARGAGGRHPRCGAQGGRRDDLAGTGTGRDRGRPRSHTARRRRRR